jgi:tetratricopeptide (TPR) repeat protein
MLASLLVALVVALTPAQAYNQGNQLYARKDYAGAATAYQRALAAGPNAAVQYNLGNAWFKAGRIGQAILQYRRAHYLAPRDADVATNLEFARNYRVDKVLTVPGPLTRALDAAVHRLSRREAALLATLAFALAMLALAGWVVRRWPALAIAAGALAIVAALGFVCERAWTGEIADHPAVVTAPEVDALSGPSEESKQILLLHDGTEVRVRETRGGYSLVQLPGGSGGWIRKDAVEAVY